MGAGQKQERSSRSKRAGKLKTRKLTMEQPSDPSAPHQVIYIVQAAKEKVNIKDAYNVKAATVLGIIHIIFALISLGIEITNLVIDNLSVATGIWTSVLFFISGGLAIGGARSGNKCLVVATMVMSIISALVAGSLIFTSAEHLSFLDANPNKYYDNLYDRDYYNYKRDLDVMYDYKYNYNNYKKDYS